ncbi:MAG TPA: hypothetical protein VMA96_03070 [Solirubrobacteraceae bacterium]|nr:hypothetical protein [Solirubrobacteraceae bacterium]
MTAPSLTHSPPACRTQRVVLSDGEPTWTVLDADHRVAEPAEQFLEYLRMLGAAHGENLELRRQLGRRHRPPAA